MSSTEEYLDNLLKEALESEKKNTANSDNQVKVEKTVKEDPNRALGADEIAALFAEAGIAETEEVVESSLDMQEETQDINTSMEIPDDEVVIGEKNSAESAIEVDKDGAEEKSEDPNRALGADEIAALFAEVGIADAETEEKPEDPNRALGADEIAALFVEAGIGEAPVEIVETEIEDEFGDGLEFNLNDTKMTNLVKEGNEDSDMADLLELMADGDDDLAEIKELLESSDKNEPIRLDEEDAEEIIPEKNTNRKEKKKKEKRSWFGKKKKEIEETVEEEVKISLQESSDKEIESVSDTVISFGEESEFSETKSSTDESQGVDLLSQIENGDFSEFEELVNIDGDFDEQLFDIPEKNGTTPIDADSIPDKKKKGVIARFFDMLMEEVEEEEEIPEIKEKTKEEKKAKKDKKKNKTENEEIMDELDSEDAQEKKGKKKKNKKVKVPKAPVEDLNEPIGKKLPRKMVIRISALCASILLLIVLISNGIISYTSLKTARSAYYNREYEVAYRNLVGKKLNKNDQLILEKTTLIMKVQRKYDSYINYTSLGNDVYACNALLNGYKLCVENYELAVEHSVEDEINSLKRLIVNALEDSYGISEEVAVQLISMEDTYEYQNSLNEFVGKE